MNKAVPIHPTIKKKNKMVIASGASFSASTRQTRTVNPKPNMSMKIRPTSEAADKGLLGFTFILFMFSHTPSLSFAFTSAPLSRIFLKDSRQAGMTTKQISALIPCGLCRRVLHCLIVVIPHSMRNPVVAPFSRGQRLDSRFHGNDGIGFFHALKVYQRAINVKVKLPSRRQSEFHATGSFLTRYSFSSIDIIALQ